MSSALKEIVSQVQAPLNSELCRSAAAKVGAYSSIQRSDYSYFNMKIMHNSMF